VNTPANQQTFKQELSRLNTAQQEAVNTLEGPVLVIAGPGTGKTQILAARIGNILSSEFQLAQPENILCLTYTDAGTIAMRKRLLQFIGPDAYRVHIHTFHSFCNKIIQENKDVFGVRDLDPITELEQVKLYRQLIDGLAPSNPLKRLTGDAYFEMGRMAQLFRLMKTEGWTEALLLQKIDEYLADLPQREEYIYKKGNSKTGVKAGDVKTEKIKEQTEKMNLLKAAVGEFKNFEAMMRKSCRYDYDDMILWVQNAFAQDENLLRNYQEQYLYFLVDEFQDTNGAQNDILKKLVSYWDAPNVFVVGDDDQSIYRFQGANIENIMQFSHSYAEQLRVVMLTENYRSTQHILNLALHLIRNNTERLVKQTPGLEKNLIACNENYAQLEVLPQLREYYNSVHETVHIAQEIETRFKNGEDLSEIAVLYRNHKQAEEISRYLEQKNISVNIRKKLNILTSLFVQKMLTILEYLSGEAYMPHSREDLLFEILHYDFFQIPAIDIARFAADIRDKRTTFWREELQKIKGKTQNNLFQTQPESARAMRRLSDDLEYWIQGVHNITLQQLFEKILTRGGVLGYIMRHKEKVWLMQELTSLFDFIKEESVKHPGISIREFLKTITLMREYEISLDINKITFATKGVNFITAHSSKGLEFETVYLIGCQSKEWDKPARNRGYTLPDNLMASTKAGDESEEARRLFYVALTRAKKELLIAYSSLSKDQKETEKSRFVAELESFEQVHKEQISLPDEALLEYNLLSMQENKQERLELIDKAWIDKQLENYCMSVTHLNNYLKCPFTFYFQNLLRVPAAKNASMSFGSAVHDALDRYFKKMLDSETKTFPPIEDLMRDFDYFMYRHQDSFTKEEYERRRQYGDKILPKYVTHYLPTWNKVVTTERSIRTGINQIPINGKIDKIEFNGRLCHVVDYKTGQFKNAKKKLNPPIKGQLPENATFEEKFGGDYWRQAVFYKILMDAEQSKQWEMVSAEFDFIEPTDKEGKIFEKVRIEITQEDLTIVKGQIMDTYARIQNKEFDKGCGEPDCKWCNFVKHFVQPDAPVDEEMLQAGEDWED
jgi:DNA helicase-2/ATP-dependent DNA helicase PcrA